MLKNFAPKLFNNTPIVNKQNINSKKASIVNVYNSP